MLIGRSRRPITCTLRAIVVDEVQLSLGSNLWSAGGGIRDRHAARLWSRRGHAGQQDDCSREEERLGHWYRGGWGSYTTSRRLLKQLYRVAATAFDSR